VLERKLTSDIRATIDYAYGGVLDLERPGIGWDAIHSNLKQTWRHSAAIKLNGTLPRWKTEWIASYRWTSGGALTPVDLFNASAGQTDGFLNFFVRQPVPHVRFMPGHMEAIIDLRNLLAQGYIPVVGRIRRVPGPVSPQRPRWRGVHLLRSRLCSSFAKAVTSGTAGSEAGLWACLDRLQTDHAEFSALETLRAPNKTSCQRLNNGLPGGGPWL
jgi:hypothetical protein